MKLLDKVAESIYIREQDLFNIANYPSYESKHENLKEYWRLLANAAISAIDFNLRHCDQESCNDDDCMICLLKSAKKG